MTVTFTNNTDAYFDFYFFFRLNVLHNGVWHSIPEISGRPPSITLSHRVYAGKAVTRTFDWLSIYGDMPPGIYRFVQNDMYVVFEIGNTF